MADTIQEKTDGNRVASAESDEVVRDERNHVVLQGKGRLGITALALKEEECNDMGRTMANRIDYLEGVRGLLGFQTLLWIFFRFFAPAIVTDSGLDGVYPATFLEESPEWMSIIRKVLSPLLFDGSLQMAGFIIITGRVSLQTFMERREPTSLAGQCVRRPIRLVIPVALALTMTSIISATNGFKYSAWLSERLKNDFLVAPVPWKSAVLYFNSLVAFFLSPKPYKTSVAVMSIPPYGVMWFVSAIFERDSCFRASS